jgi:hypothetical protein
VNDKQYYLEIFEQYEEQLSAAETKGEEVSEEAQALMLAHIGEFIMPNDAIVLTSAEAEEYRALITGLLQHIANRAVYRNKQLPLAYKAYVLKLKYGDRDFNRKWIIQRLKVGATILNVSDGRLHIEGLSKTDLAGPGAVCYVKDNKKHKYDLQYYRVAAFDQLTVFGDAALAGTGFKVDLPLEAGLKYEFVLVDSRGGKHVLPIRFGKFSRLTSAVENTYFAEGKYIVKYLEDKIKVYGLTLRSLLASEYRYEKDLKTAGKGYLLGLRRRALWKKARKKKPLWLISDRTNIAGDNGEALYRFMQGLKTPLPYAHHFVIDKSSRGFKTLSDLKGIVDYNSKDYKLKFLLSDKIISSQWADWVYNAFGEDRDYMKDLYAFQFIYLRHGIMKNDMSNWSHKLRKNISLIFASSRHEQSMIKLETYGYEKSQVILTGMPRYDLLESAPQKIVSIMPTWRKYIKIETTRGRSERQYSPEFKETGYFRFYNQLINDPRLLSKMKEKGYTGNFYVHPLFEAQYVDFVGNEVIGVPEGTADYNKVFRESSLLVTDYSSVDMDFSYMKKPVVYTQFDKELFFSTHTYRESSAGSISSGFGPVCFDYESTIAAIIDYLEKDCVQEQVYSDRVDAFYEFTDRNNCKRALAAIEV